MPYNVTLDRAGVDDVKQTFGETTHGQRLELDRLLVQFWNSHSIR